MTQADRLNQILDALPQAGRITHEKRKKWIEHVLSMEGIGLDVERIGTRLGGLTGTQTGPLVEAARGMSDPFGDTPVSIMREKLCESLPSPMTGDMRRGIILEPVLKELYLKETGGESDESLLEAIRSHSGSLVHPWLIGTPDDLVRIKGRLVLVDYKCPYLSPPRNPEKVHFRYVVQLHHYRLIAKDLGIIPDEMLLVEFDLKNGKYVVVPVEHQPEIDQEIRKVGDRFWSQLLDGRVEEDDRRKGKSIQLSGLGSNIQKELLKLLKLKMISDIIDSEIEEARTTIGSTLMKMGHSKGRIDGPGYSLSLRPTFNMQEALDWLIGQGVDTTEMVRLREALDPQKLLKELTRLGGNADLCRKEEVDEDAVMVAIQERGVDLSVFAAEPGLTLRCFGEVAASIKSLARDTVGCWLYEKLCWAEEDLTEVPF